MKNTTIGPLGFPMSDAMAKAADEALKHIPAELRDRVKTRVTDADGNKIEVAGYIRRSMNVKGMDFNDDERADVSVITSGSVDRDSEVVLPKGLDFDQFRKGPAVQLCHNYTLPSIARCLWIKQDTLGDGSDAWKAKSAYTKRPSDFPEGQEWLPETTWFYVREKLLNGKSIGFIPTNMRAITPDDLRANPDYADAYCIIDKALVLEYSVCPIGANPDALVEGTSKMMAKGLKTKSLMDALGIIIPDAMPSAEDVTKKTLTNAEIQELRAKGHGVVKGACGHVVRQCRCADGHDARLITTCDELCDQCKAVIAKSRSFVRPETIAEAAKAIAKNALADAPKTIMDALTDRLHREMGRV